MTVYRAWYGWFDEHDHIGTYDTEVGAWIACYNYYKKNITYRVCWKHWDTPHFGYGCECHKHRLRGSRYKRLHITEEEVFGSPKEMS